MVSNNTDNQDQQNGAPITLTDRKRSFSSTCRLELFFSTLTMLSLLFVPFSKVAKHYDYFGYSQQTEKYYLVKMALSNEHVVGVVLSLLFIIMAMFCVATERPVAHLVYTQLFAHVLWITLIEGEFEFSDGFILMTLFVLIITGISIYLVVDYAKIKEIEEHL